MKTGKLAKVELLQSRNQHPKPARVVNEDEICKTKSRKVEQREMNENSGNSNSLTDNNDCLGNYENRLRKTGRIESGTDGCKCKFAESAPPSKMCNPKGLAVLEKV